MAYADQEMSKNKLVAIILVALIHVAIGYALLTGLAYSAFKKAVERVTTVDIEEPPPPEEEPPPPPEPDTAPPPPVAPPPPINISVAPPPIQVQTNIPPPAPPARIIPPAAPPAPPPAPPPPPPQRANPEPRGRPQSWVTNDDYPSRAVRDELEGTVRFRLTVGSDGRVSNCDVTGSSGHSILDDEVCRLMARRARFNPALDAQGNPTTGTWSSSFRWQLTGR